MGFTITIQGFLPKTFLLQTGISKLEIQASLEIIMNIYQNGVSTG